MCVFGKLDINFALGKTDGGQTLDCGRLRAQKADMAQRPNARFRIVRTGWWIKTRRHFFISSGFNQIRKALIDLGKVRRQHAVLHTKRLDPAVGGRICLGMPDHNRGLMHLRVICLGSSGKVSLGNRYRIAVCIGTRPCAKNFVRHKKASSDG